MRAREGESTHSAGWEGTIRSDHKEYLACRRPSPTLALGLAAARCLSYMGAGSKMLHQGPSLWYPGSPEWGQHKHTSQIHSSQSYTHNIQLHSDTNSLSLNHTDHIIVCVCITQTMYRYTIPRWENTYYLVIECYSHNLSDIEFIITQTGTDITHNNPITHNHTLILM